ALRQDFNALDNKLHYKEKFNVDNIEPYDFINTLMRIEYDENNGNFISNCYINENKAQHEITYKTCYYANFVDEGLLIKIENESIDEDEHNVEQATRILLELKDNAVIRIKQLFIAG